LPTTLREAFHWMARLPLAIMTHSLACEASDVRVELELGILAKAAGIDPVRLSNNIGRRLLDRESGSVHTGQQP